jgi:hypothetical protein
MPNPTPQEIREVLLEEIAASEPRNPTDGSLQQNTVLRRVIERLNIANDIDLERVVLAEWYWLFNTGYLAWGHNLQNPAPPFCHVTTRGRNALETLSRDPGNPAGYLAFLHTLAPLNPVAMSYLVEGLDCYVGGHHKAAAVTLGGASESIVLELRDHLVKRLGELGQAVPPKLNDWRVKAVLDEMQQFVDARKATLPHDSREEFSAYWPAFTQQIRAVRNDAGHPSSVDPVSPESAHASFLVFPLVARLAARLNDWIDQQLS